MQYNNVIYIVSISWLLLFTSCDTESKPSQTKEEIAVEVKQAMDGMVSAWNNHELEKAFAYYWNSPELTWINRGGVSKGYQPVLEGYQKDFEDRNNMGVYTYKLLHEDLLSDSVVFTTIKWNIQVGEDSFGGISSLIWKKIDGQWVITKEHAS